MMERILFYSLDAAPLFDLSIKTPIGGAELRAFNFAKYLANSGYKVYIIVSHLTQKKIIKDNVIIKAVSYFRKDKAFILKIRMKALYFLRYKNRFSYNDFLKYSEFFLTIPSHICLFGITGNTISAAKISQALECKILLFIASDEEINFHNIMDKTKLGTSFSEVHDLLSISKKVFVQNKYQQERLSTLFNIEAQLLLNPISLKQKYSGIFSDYILWVGKSSLYKNPKLFIELAQHFKDQKFLMICNKTDESLFSSIKRELPSNCLLIEHVMPEEIESYFHKCKIFINTSDFEGFPNTFLQAAKYGKPIVSYKVNPNDFLTENDCGIFCSGSSEKLLDGVSQLLKDKALYSHKSQNSLKNVEKHAVENVSGILSDIIKN